MADDAAAAAAAAAPLPSSPKDDDNNKDKGAKATTTTTTTATPTVEELAAQLTRVDLDQDETADPTLHSGELQVRQAGKASMGECDVEKVTSFQALPISAELKKSIADMGWQTMSKIQQRAIPLLLHDPPAHCIAQAQAGTGKTGTFVISALARIDNVARASQPQAIILAVTQELVTQIAQVVTLLGKDMGVKARRIMGASSQGGGAQGAGAGGAAAGRGRGRGRGGAPGGGGADANGGGAPTQPSWALAPGEDFTEQVVVGTPQKVLQYLTDFQRARKPCIDPREVRVLVLDEADQMVQQPPHGFGDYVVGVRNAILENRRGKPVQLMLFSATYTDAVRETARQFVGNDKRSYHELLLKREDQTLDNVENFFIFVGKENDAPLAVRDAKFEAVVKMWESLADSPLQGQTVIFVESRARAKDLAEFLRGKGYEAGQIHGDMDKVERETVFREFRENKRPVLVATNVLSRGIDNPNVTLVVNVDLPLKHGSREPDPETFVHRIGRSGRWTRGGMSVSLVAAGDSHDRAVITEIERKLFAPVNRPLIQVADPSLLGDAFAKRLAAKKKEREVAKGA